MDIIVPGTARDLFVGAGRNSVRMAAAPTAPRLSHEPTMRLRSRQCGSNFAQNR